MKKFAILALALLGAGCAEYRYIPPATEAGQFCVQQCGLQRQQCQTAAMASSQQCNAMRNIALASFNRCRAAGGGISCQQPPACFNEGFRCSGAFDQCFQSCGGRIEEVRR